MSLARIIAAGLEVDHAGDESLEKVSSKKLAKDAFDVENLGDGAGLRDCLVHVRWRCASAGGDIVNVIGGKSSAAGIAFPRDPSSCLAVALPWPDAELRALSERHSVEEVRVLSRLMSGKWLVQGQRQLLAPRPGGAALGGSSMRGGTRRMHCSALH